MNEFQKLDESEQMLMLHTFNEFGNMLRIEFPLFAKEIDELIYNVGHNHLTCCDDKNCEHLISFEMFHQLMNEKHNT